MGPGSYNPKHTYNDIIYDNHIVQIERKRPIWLRNNNRHGSNKRLKELMSQTSNFLTPKRNDLLLEFGGSCVRLISPYGHVDFD